MNTNRTRIVAVASGALALQFLAGCASVSERFEAGQLVSRQVVVWSISPRAVETDGTKVTIMVTDTAESMRAAGDLVGTAAATAAKEMVKP